MCATCRQYTRTYKRIWSLLGGSFELGRYLKSPLALEPAEPLFRHLGSHALLFGFLVDERYGRRVLDPGPVIDEVVPLRRALAARGFPAEHLV